MKINYPYYEITRLYFNKLVSDNKISKDTSIIAYGINGYTKALSEIIKEEGYKLILVVMDGDDCSYFSDIELLKTPSFLGSDEVELMARDMAQDLENSVLIDFKDNKDISSIIFKNGKLFSEGDTVIVQSLTATEINGIAKLYKLKYDSKVILDTSLINDTDNVDFDLIDEKIESIKNISDGIIIAM